MIDNNIKTISDLVNSISAEMEQLDYKPSVLKQYHIVWDKLCTYAGERSIEAFNISFGMDFLEEVLHIHSHPLSESTTHRWMKAIYLLSDFKRTGIITLRKPKREFLFADAFKQPFSSYVEHLKSLERSEAYIRDTSLYLERFSVYLASSGISDICQIDTEHIHGYVNSLAVYELPTIYHNICMLRNVLKYLYDSGSRVQEIADLTIGDIRTDSPATLKVMGKGGKSRIIPLMAQTANLVKKYISDFGLDHSTRCKHPLFTNRSGAKLTRAGIKYILDKYVQSARIENGSVLPEIISPHSFRHSKAMHLLHSGVNLIYIRDILGHADLKTTEIYARIDGEMKRKALEEAFTQTAPTEEVPIWQQDGDMLEWLKNLGKE